MKDYQIFIKSHISTLDYEDSCEAESKEEAAETFQERIGGRGGDWGIEDLLPHIEEIK